MPNFQLQDTYQVPYTINELDADGNPATLQTGDVVTVVSSAPASVSVVPDATPVSGSLASGTLLGGSTLAVGTTITATVTHTDGVTASATDLIDTIGSEGTSLTIGLGAPVPQPAAPPATASAKKKA